MTTLVYPSEITAKTVEEVYEQVVTELEESGYTVANTDDELLAALSAGSDDVTSDEITTREAQRFQLDGIEKGKYVAADGTTSTYIPTITVVIFENYTDSASDDYVYMVSVYEY